jgi:hypothetical protein
MGSVVESVVGFLGAKKQAEATEEAAKTGAQSAQYAADLQRQMFEKQMAAQEPWRQAGVTALNQLAPLAQQYQPFGMDQFQADPGYGFRLSEGMKALERSAAARGGLMSGAQMKGIQRYGQDLASQEYQNAFNRYQAERQARLNPLQSLAGLGQTSAQSIGGAAGQLGTNLGNIALGAGATAGAAQLAMGNLRASQYGNIGKTINDVVGSPTVQNWLAQFNQSPAQQAAGEFVQNWSPEFYG